MNAMRYAAAAVTVSLAAVLLHYSVIIPLQLNTAKRVVYRGTQKAVSVPPAMSAALARENVERLSVYRNRPDFDAESLVLLAANSSLIQRKTDAIRLYLLAAEREGRPEIYRYLATAELEAGETASAVRHFARACEFAPSTIELVPAELQAVVKAQLAARH